MGTRREGEWPLLSEPGWSLETGRPLGASVHSGSRSPGSFWTLLPSRLPPATSPVRSTTTVFCLGGRLPSSLVSVSVLASSPPFFPSEFFKYRVELAARPFKMPPRLPVTVLGQFHRIQRPAPNPQASYILTEFHGGCGERGWGAGPCRGCLGGLALRTPASLCMAERRWRRWCRVASGSAVGGAFGTRGT